ncbi:hypothetical protein ACS0TY_022020 [Phlomoides rotata]
MVDGSQFYVDLEKSSCGCRKWDLTCIPCIHAIRFDINIQLHLYCLIISKSLETLMINFLGSFTAKD